MEILSLAGSLIASFIIFYTISIGTIVILFKLFFKPIPEDELIETKEEIASTKKITTNSRKTTFRPTLSIAE